MTITKTGLTTLAPPRTPMRGSHGKSSIYHYDDDHIDHDYNYHHNHHNHQNLHILNSHHIHHPQHFQHRQYHTHHDNDCHRCATEVDNDGYVVDNAWGDCLDGCPGTRKYFDDNNIFIVDHDDHDDGHCNDQDYHHCNDQDDNHCNAGDVKVSIMLFQVLSVTTNTFRSRKVSGNYSLV